MKLVNFFDYFIFILISGVILVVGIWFIGLLNLVVLFIIVIIFVVSVIVLKFREFDVENLVNKELK